MTKDLSATALRTLSTVGDSTPALPTFTIAPPPPTPRIRAQSTPHNYLRSISTPFSPTPLPASFSCELPIRPSSHPTSPHLTLPSGACRLHSRNLSVFFLRPGFVSHGTINEDGAQELEIPVNVEAPLIPLLGSRTNALRKGLHILHTASIIKSTQSKINDCTTFLQIPPHPPLHDADTFPAIFFFFMESGSGPPLNNEERVAWPTYSNRRGPLMSAFPASATPSESGFNVDYSHAFEQQHRNVEQGGKFSYGAAAVVSLIQFVLGARLVWERKAEGRVVFVTRKYLNFVYSHQRLIASPQPSAWQ